MRLLIALIFSFSVSRAFAALPACYQAFSAKEKQELLWQHISENAYGDLPALDSAGGPSLRELFFSGIGNAFTHPHDEIASKRTKVIHKFGSAVKIRFVADPNSVYTGIFRSGALGIARLSLALPFQGDGRGNFVPGLALKLFVDGQASKNLTVMEKLEGQGSDTNYFKSVFTNILPDPKATTTKFGTWVFEGFVENAIHLQVDHVAQILSDGQAVASVKAPYQLLFQPANGIAIDSKASDFRDELAKIPAGTALYDVYGKETDEAGSPVTKIGTIITDSEFVSSQYGDETLYFQHAGTALKSGYILRWIHGIR